MDPATMAMLAGGAMSLASSIFGGGQDKPQQIPTMNRQQQQLLNSNIQRLQQMGIPFDQAIQMLQGYMDPNSEQFKNFEAPYMQQFQQETIPMLAERFAGAGAQGGALSSSGFGQALGTAGANLQTNLAQMKSQMGMNAGNSLMNMYSGLSGQSLGAQPFAYYQQDKGSGGLPNFAATAGQGLLNAGMAGYMNKGFGQGNQNQFPLTGMYDSMFRTGALV